MIDKLKFKEQFSYFDKEVVVEIINIFEEEYPGRMADMTRFIHAKNLTELRKAAHGFKGVIGNFELDGDSYNLAKELEIHAHQFEEEENAGKLLSEDEKEIIFEQFLKTFFALKTTSYQLLLELTEIKMGYMD